MSEIIITKDESGKYDVDINGVMIRMVNCDCAYIMINDVFNADKVKKVRGGVLYTPIICDLKKEREPLECNNK